jgi:thioesterase domain-containing protein/alkylation response protein AidB-like acyl-CoA dehydrogenase/acyl carrier protein
MEIKNGITQPIKVYESSLYQANISQGSRDGNGGDYHMSLEDLLSELSQHRIQISAENDRLRVRAPKGKVTPELKTTLKQFKTELLELLSQTKSASGLASTLTPIPLISRDGHLQVSMAQGRLWLVDQLQSGIGLYNLPMAFRLAGNLDPERLDAALRAIVDRHEVLRTIYPSNGSGPKVVIQEKAPPTLSVIDLQQQSDAERQALKLVAKISKQPFKLDQGPLINYTLIQVSSQEYLLAIVVHHMVADGWSLGLIISELSALYNAAAQDSSFVLPELPFQYVDFAAWHQQWLAGDDLHPQVQYWQHVFAGSPEALKLPLDRAYSASHNTQGRCQSFDIGSSLSQALTAFCQQEGKSQFTVLLASFRALLHCYSGQNDLIICSAVAGRSRSDTQKLVGYFNNILPLRTQVSSGLTFRELVDQEQKTVTAIYDYPDVPLQQIANFPSLAGIPLSRALFVLQSQQNGPQQSLKLDQITVQALSKEEMEIDTADFDLAIFVEPDDDKISGYIQYKTHLFDGATLQTLFQHWMVLLEGAIAQPKATLAEISPLETVAQEQLRDKINTLHRSLDTTSDYLAPRNSVELQLANIWQTVLNLEQVGVKDNFFDLGGKSLAAIELFSQIEKTFNQKLPFSKIFQAPSIEKLATLLTAEEAPEWTSLVAIKPEGSKPPLFCMHSVEPSVLHYRNIATYLDQEQPFYALQPPALGGEENLIFKQIEGMAAHFIQEMQSLQPNGPYSLLGHSGGGVVAYEVARQLEEKGHSVEFLGMIDTFAPGHQPRPRLHMPPLYYQIYIHFFNLARVEPRRKIGYVLERLKGVIPSFIWKRINKAAFLINDTIHNELPEIYKNLPIYREIKLANYEAFNSYAPDYTYSGKISLYRSIERPTTIRDDLFLGWGKVTGKEVRVCEIPGHHNTMVHEPYVQILAKQIQLTIDNKTMNEKAIGEKKIKVPLKHFSLGLERREATIIPEKTTILKDELVDRAKALAPGIAGRTAEIEAQRSPHNTTIRELIDAEFMQLLVPKRWGGHELGLDALVEIVETLSAACVSTGWIAAFYLGHNWMVTKFSEQAQAEVFADRPFGLIPTTTSPTLKATPVSGGWEVSGRASWGSGIMHADWVVLGGIADNEPRVFLIPASDVQIEDVWHMSAMAGTGSNDILVSEVFVPAHRSLPSTDFSGGITEGSLIHANPIYHLPAMPFIYCETMGIFSGGLRGATTAFDQTVQRRVTTHAAAVMREKQHAHILLGEAHTKAMIAEGLVREQVRQTNAFMEEGQLTIENRLQLKAHAGFLVDHCRQSVNDMMNRAGATNFRSDAPLQRYFRDLNMLAGHAFWDWESCREQLGRLHLGLEPNHPLI